MSLEYNKKIIPRAQELRRDMTKQERKLWFLFLNKQKIRFQRQKVIDSFIADFYCHSAKLIIEIDGSQHYTEDGMAYDEQRTKVLNAYHLKVIRFSNQDIDYNFDGVCLLIEQELETSNISSPSSRGNVSKADKGER